MSEATKKKLINPEQIMTALAQGKTVYVEDDDDPTRYKVINGFICVVDAGGNVVFIGDGINTAAGYDTYTIEDAPFVMSAGKWVDSKDRTWYIAYRKERPKTSVCRFIGVREDGNWTTFDDDGHCDEMLVQLVCKIGEW